MSSKWRRFEVLLPLQFNDGRDVPLLTDKGKKDHMSHRSLLPERLQRAFTPTSGGVLGIVDALLELCRERGLQLDWHPNQCRVRPLGTEPQEAIEISVPKSAFRAILARVAALCNERTPNSVSPYGGEGELSIGTNPPTVLRVAFTNTPDEQRLEVSLGGNDKDEERDIVRTPGATGEEASRTH